MRYHLTHSDRSLFWMHILFLFAVSMTPFSTLLVGRLHSLPDRAADLLGEPPLPGGTLFFTWVCALASARYATFPQRCPLPSNAGFVIGQALYAW